jgi:menaquinol-cytochrome c reductase cytochrome b/c subunit
MSEPPRRFAAEFDSDGKRTPVRIAFVTRRTSPQVKAADEPVVMTFPEAMFRVAVAMEALAIFLVVLSLLWEAPLEGLADPSHTPNPAKAPWYFLGLQELLHYFPPLVAGVLIPTLVVIALIVIPYFNINIESEGIWLRNRARRLRVFALVLGLFTALTLAFRLYAALIPTLGIAALMLLAARSSPQSPQRFRQYLAARPLSYWVMTWFLVQASVLTAIGTFFRGPGWSWVWPWVWPWSS